MTAFTITFPGGKRREFQSPVTGAGLLPEFRTDGHPVYAVLVNNELYSLNREIAVTAEVQPLTDETTEGSNVYRRTLCFILAAAAAALYPERKLQVGHSLGHSYYYALTAEDEKNGGGSGIDFTALDKKMREIIAADLPIRNRFVSYREALEIFRSNGQDDTYRLLNQLGRPRFLINSIKIFPGNPAGEFTDLYYLPLLPSTGLANIFHLMPYGKGFLLRFPPTAHPGRLEEFRDIPKLSSVYRKYRDWGRRIGVSSAGELNDVIIRGGIKEFMEITETLQNRHFAEIADNICSRPDVRVVMLAGPSSSGKTTSAKKLSLQLRVLGYEPKVISLDNYYRGQDSAPLGADGKPDYECLEALDVPLFNRNLLDLFDGREVEIPVYDFKTGSRKPEGFSFRMNARTILIVEGIHGLNDNLTPNIPAERKYKVYLSALTQLTLDDHNRIPTSDNRLIRRIVRDAQFRNKGAAGTIAMWGAVRRGEQAHIFPFQNQADIMLNTALDYELPVLKVYAEPLLRAVKPVEPEYAKASELLGFLSNFMPVSSSCVPGQSILREFIGESDFKY